MKYFWLFQRFSDLEINPINTGFVTLEHGQESYGNAENIVNWNNPQQYEIRGEYGNNITFHFTKPLIIKKYRMRYKVDIRYFTGWNLMVSIDQKSYAAIDDKDEHFCFGQTSINNCNETTTRTFNVPISTAKSTKITMIKPDSKDTYWFQPLNIDFYVISASSLFCTLNDWKIHIRLSLLFFCFCIHS